MIPAHGGRLINRIASGAEKTALQERAARAPRVKLNARETSDLEMLGTGAIWSGRRCSGSAAATAAAMASRNARRVSDIKAYSVWDCARRRAAHRLLTGDSAAMRYATTSAIWSGVK